MAVKAKALQGEMQAGQALGKPGQAGGTETPDPPDTGAGALPTSQALVRSACSAARPGRGQGWRLAGVDSSTTGCSSVSARGADDVWRR